MCVCVSCGGYGGGEWVGACAWVWKGGWCYVCVRCESELFV